MPSDLSTVLRALAEIRRSQIVAIKGNPATADLYPDAFVHAILHSVCPAYHEDVAGTGLAREEALRLFPFRETYDVPEETVLEIGSLLDARWMAKEAVTFRELEKLYSERPWPGTNLRNDLINICRYFFLRRMFDGDDFWRTFMKEAPSQALDITRDWNRDELVIWAQA